MDDDSFTTDKNRIAQYLHFPYSDISRSAALETFISPYGSSVSVPKYINALIGNTYNRNFGGMGQGLIDVTGMIRFLMQDESFNQNGENLVEITNYMIKTYPFISGDLSYNSQKLGSYSLINYIPYLKAT